MKKIRATKRLMSLSQTGREVSQLTRDKLSKAAKSRVTSELTKQKLSESCSGWHQSDDVKKRISQSRSKTVLQFSTDGVLLNEYPSIKEAVRLSGVSGISLSRSLREGRVRANYLWKYKEAESN